MYKNNKIKNLFFILLLIGTHNAFSQSFKTEKIEKTEQPKPRALTKFLNWYGLDDLNRKCFVETMVGKLYYQGKVFQRNDKEAFRLFKVAAENGFKEAQFNLAVMYEEGKVVEQNYDEAEKWYILSAKQGHIDAQFHIGLLLVKLQNKDKKLNNDEEVIKWWSLAANNGHPEAKHWINMIEKSAKDEVMNKNIL
jgi:TPR repeat protein